VSERERERERDGRHHDSYNNGGYRDAIVEGADAQTLRRLVTPERLKGNTEPFVHLK